jgi:hypothetical protein
VGNTRSNQKAKFQSIKFITIHEKNSALQKQKKVNVKSSRDDISKYNEGSAGAHPRIDQFFRGGRKDPAVLERGKCI